MKTLEQNDDCLRCEMIDKRCVDVCGVVPVIEGSSRIDSATDVVTSIYPAGVIQSGHSLQYGYGLSPSDR